MNIIVRSILHYIQSKEKHKNAILAGGAVRDEKFNLVPKDYDLWVPITKKQETYQLIAEICNEFGIKSEIKNKGKDYEDMTQVNVRGVTEFTHEDLKFDIIGIVEPDDEDFPQQVIKQFDFGLNMIYDTGSYIDDSNEDFRFDEDNGYFSLINLKHVSHLPNSIARFNSWNVKAGMGWTFRAPCLKIINEREPEKLSFKRKPMTVPGGGWGGNDMIFDEVPAAPAWAEGPAQPPPIVNAGGIGNHAHGIFNPGHVNNFAPPVFNAGLHGAAIHAQFNQAQMVGQAINDAVQAQPADVFNNNPFLINNN